MCPMSGLTTKHHLSSAMVRGLNYCKDGSHNMMQMGLSEFRVTFRNAFQQTEYGNIMQPPLHPDRSIEFQLSMVKLIVIHRIGESMKLEIAQSSLQPRPPVVITSAATRRGEHLAQDCTLNPSCARREKEEWDCDSCQEMDPVTWPRLKIGMQYCYEDLNSPSYLCL
jgi:hypothetical protein